MTTPTNPANDNGNGNGKTYWWTVGLLSTILVSAAGATLTTTQHHGERIAVLESQIQDTRTELQRINRKLDQLLDHHPWRP
jgi:hypothetical protein